VLIFNRGQRELFLLERQHANRCQLVARVLQGHLAQRANQHHPGSEHLPDSAPRNNKASEREKTFSDMEFLIELKRKT